MIKKKKSATLRATLAMLLLCGLGMGGVMPVRAATAVSGTGQNTNGASATGSNATAVGDSSSASGRDATAVGKSASAYGAYSVALGLDAKVGASSTDEETSLGALALGYYSKASGTYAISLGGSTASGDSAIAEGGSASATKANSIAIGSSSKATNYSSIAIGSTARTDTGTAGFGTTSSGLSSIAVGASVVSQGTGSVAIGSSVVNSNSVSLGASATGDYTIAFGVTSSATGNYAIAVGRDANASVENSIAIGKGATVTSSAATNSVALGGGSVASEASSVSVGASTSSTRTITNVTAGDSTKDAAIWDQLVKNDTYSYDATTKTIKVKTNGDTGTNATGFTLDLSSLTTGSSDSLIIGDESKHWLDVSWNGEVGSTTVTRGTESTAYGYKANAQGKRSTAVGYNAKADSNSSVAIGNNASATNINSVAIGMGVDATGNGSIVLGNLRWFDYGDGSGVAGRSSSAEGQGAIAIGSSVFAEADGSVAIGGGYFSGTKDDLKDFVGATASAIRAVALGTAAEAKHADSVALGYGSITSETNSISIGSGNTTDGSVATRKITNVTAGSKATEAVNYSQIAAHGQTFTLSKANDTADILDTQNKSIAKITIDDFGTELAADQTVSLANTTKDDKGQTNVLKDSEGNVIATFAKGTIASDGTGFVSGADVYAETRANVSGTYVSSGSDVGTNLSNLDTHVVTNETNIATNKSDITQLKDLSNISDAGKSVIKTYSQDAVKVAAGDNVKVSEATDDNGNKTYTVSAELKDITIEVADIDASNIGANLKAEDGTAASQADIKANKDAWGTALGGTIASDSNQLVTGATVYAETRQKVSGTYVSSGSDVGTNLSNLDTHVVTNETNIAINKSDITQLKDLSNISDAGKSVLKTYSQDAVKVAAGDNVKVSEATDDNGNKTYTVSAELKDITIEVADIDASNIGANLKAEDGTAASQADIKANKDAWGTALGGSIASDSNQLVTGATVYAETRKNVSGTYVSKDSDVGTNLSTLDTHVVTNEKNIATNKSDITQLKDLSNISDAGKSVIKTYSQDAVKVAAGDNVKVSEATDGSGNKTYTVSADLENSTEVKNKANLDASNIGANLKAEDGTAASQANIKANKDAWGTALGGTIASDSNQLVTGATVYAETRENVSGTYVSSGNDVGTNLSTLDTHVVQNENNIKTNADNIKANTEKISTIETQVNTNTEKIGTIETQVKTNTETLKTNTEKIGTIETQVNTNTEKIGTIETQVKTNTETLKANTEKIGTIETQVNTNTEKIGTIETQVKTNTETIKTNTEKIGTIETKVNTNTEKLTEYSEKITTIEKQIGNQQTAVENSKVDGGSYTISANQRTVIVKNKDNSDAFTLTVEASAGGVYTSGDHINIDNDYKISVKTDGKVESGNTGIVTGGAVYEKVGDTSKLKEAGLSDNLADSVLTVNEKVDTVTNQVVDVVNNSMSTLRKDVNKVGAGAAALAALHPEGFDPEDKFSFAVGFGHYKNANSGAFGAFYKPNQDTTVSLGSTIGNGDPMINLGFSFKFGKRSAGLGIYSSNKDMIREVNALKTGDKRQVQVINAQAQRIVKLEHENKAQVNEIKELKAENAEMKAQIAQILKKLELSDTVKKTAAVH